MTTTHYFTPTVAVVRTEDGSYSVTVDWFASYDHSTDSAGTDTYESAEADAAAAALDAWKGHGRIDAATIPPGDYDPDVAYADAEAYMADVEAARQREAVALHLPTD